MINIRIDNYIRVSGLPRDLFDQVVERLTYPNPEFVNALKFSPGSARFKPRTVQSFTYEDRELCLPRGYYMEFLSNIVANSGIPYQIVDLRQSQKVSMPNTDIRLRSYQEQMVQEASLYPGISFVMQAPPGTGKTFTGLEFARRLGYKTLWITHKDGLRDQTIEEAMTVFGLKKKDIGIIGDSKFRVGDLITVATIQTLMSKKRAEQLAKLKYEFGTVIVDEVHHGPAKSWNAGIHSLAPAVTFGLTATAYRNDGLTQMLFDCIGPVVTVADTKLMAQEGVLIYPSVYVVDTKIHAHGIQHNELLDSLINNSKRNNIILDIARHVRRDPTSHNTLIILSDRREHVNEITRLCAEAGLDPLKRLGQDSKVDKALVAERLDNRSARLIITTYQLMGEGFNYPPINFILFATPFKDSIRVEQSVGRAQRTCENKDASYLLDLVDINPTAKKQARERRATYEGLGMDIYNMNASSFMTNETTQTKQNKEPWTD